MKKTLLSFIILPVLLIAAGCSEKAVPVKADFATIEYQYGELLRRATDPDCFPHSVHADGSLRCVPMDAWVSGFFAGSLWYIYDYNDNPRWREQALKWTLPLEPLRNFTAHHDVGFMVNCSFGNAYRLTGNPEFREVLIDAARSLCSRFDPRTGVIRSWDNVHMKGAQFLVIVDNMMNLELLFNASKLSGDKTFYDVAVSHADKTMRNHYRPDFSSYHVVDYDSITGVPVRKMTAQGYSDGSAWARGQAWGLYGFTMCYRETGDARYLDFASSIADFLLGHRNLPEDMVFYWDFDAPGIPDEPRDVSASCITASALLELSKYVEGEDAERYYAAAEKMLASLSAPPYMAARGENGNFVLTGSVGSKPANSEVGVPMSYADYYFLEALLRYLRY